MRQLAVDLHAKWSAAVLKASRGANTNAEAQNNLLLRLVFDTAAVQKKRVFSS